MIGLSYAAPHPARRYNYWLGGKDHFAADRASGDAIAEAFPVVVELARANRAFLRRAVRFLAESGVTQFLDIGTGLPAPENTHEVAQRIAPESRVVATPDGERPAGGSRRATRRPTGPTIGQLRRE